MPGVSVAVRAHWFSVACACQMSQHRAAITPIAISRVANHRSGGAIRSEVEPVPSLHAEPTTQTRSPVATTTSATATTRSTKAFAPIETTARRPAVPGSRNR